MDIKKLCLIITVGIILVTYVDGGRGGGGGRSSSGGSSGRSYSSSSSSRNTGYGSSSSSRNTGYGSSSSSSRSTGYSSSSSSSNTGYGSSSSSRNTDYGSSSSSGNTGYGSSSSSRNTDYGSGSSSRNTGYGSSSSSGNTGDGSSSSSKNTGDGSSSPSRNTGYDSSSSSRNTDYGSSSSSRNTGYGSSSSSGNTGYGSSSSSGNTGYGSSNSFSNKNPSSSHYPYPKQPGWNLPPPPPYARHSGIPWANTQYAQPYKKQGFFGQIFSRRKSNENRESLASNFNVRKTQLEIMNQYPNHEFRRQYGVPKPMFPIMPSTLNRHGNYLSFSKYRTSSIIYVPVRRYHYYPVGYDYDIYDSSYRGQCRRPLKSAYSTIDCTTSAQQVTCTIQCNENYRLDGKDTTNKHICWHSSGVWRPIKNFPKCIPTCNDECLNGGTCIEPGLCICPAEYRGAKCESHILKCDIHKLAANRIDEISWTCHHTRNATSCKIRCRYGAQFETGNQTQKYQCKINGEWIPNSIPNCVTGDNGKNGTISTTAVKWK